VPADAVAVTGNLTVTNQSAAGLLALGPTMFPTGSTTTLNFVVGENRANNVTMGLNPSDGTLSAVFRSSTAGATVDVLFDVTGYFSTDPADGTYHALPPGRVLDTRPTSGTRIHIGLAGKFVSRVVRTIQVSGVKALGWTGALVPANASAITANLTIVNATTSGYVSLGPTMTRTPSSSSMNVMAGKTIANGVTVTLKTGRVQAVWVGKTGSSADFILDVTGYFLPGRGGLQFYPVDPYRVLDSANNVGVTGPMATGAPAGLAVAGTGGVAVDAKGIAGNLTLVSPTSTGWAAVSPSITTIPSSSTVNSYAGVTVANGFDVPLNAGQVMFGWYGTTNSTANLSIDVNGYWR